MVPASGTPLRAHRLRPVNLPRRVSVELDKRGFPETIVAGERISGWADVKSEENSSTHPLIRSSVAAIGEVWRVYDEWWRQPIMRRYFEIVLAGGKHTIIYQDEVSGEWFEQTP